LSETSITIINCFQEIKDGPEILNWYIYGFDQGLELCSCGPSYKIYRAVALYSYIIITYYKFLKLNFVPNLHYKDVNVTPLYKFVWSSNQERGHQKSGGGCTFLFQKENLDGEDDNFCTYTI